MQKEGTQLGFQPPQTSFRRLQISPHLLGHWWRTLITPRTLHKISPNISIPVLITMSIFPPPLGLLQHLTCTQLSFLTNLNLLCNYHLNPDFCPSPTRCTLPLHTAGKTPLFSMCTWIFCIFLERTQGLKHAMEGFLSLNHTASPLTAGF